MADEKIWVESLLDATQWKEMSKLYPNCYKSSTPIKMFVSEFKWRVGMGASLTVEEINIINSRIDAVLKKAGKI